MAIPEFDGHGNLPLGVHEATWGEIVARFGGTPERRHLLAGLRDALDVLMMCGCRRAWLDGSFITAMEPLAPCLAADFQQDRQGRRKGIVCLTLAGEEGARQ